MRWRKSSAVDPPESGLDLNLLVLLDLNLIVLHEKLHKLSWGILSEEQILSGWQ